MLLEMYTWMNCMQYEGKFKRKQDKEHQSHEVKRLINKINADQCLSQLFCNGSTSRRATCFVNLVTEILKQRIQGPTSVKILLPIERLLENLKHHTVNKKIAQSKCKDMMYH